MRQGCRFMVLDPNGKHLYGFYKSILHIKFINRDFRNLKRTLCKTVIKASLVIKIS